LSAQRFELPEVSACAYTNDDNDPLTGSMLFDIDIDLTTGTATGKIRGPWPLTSLTTLGQPAE
jgi:hypothetical protein